ncbi:ATP synthase subunit C [Helicovermis profundi]|uniref:ATP synthase F(0) sector subunit c n=1 Tax=Helicovermis profundi TaxID=3065157 RepID=A0AAU9EQ29_9FIRM|nr:hypothetical protein HLPR_26000 [Clostridia bacterium S502]
MKITLAMSILVVFFTILSGFYYILNEEMTDKKKLKKILKINISVFVPVILIGIMYLIPDIAHAATNTAAASTSSGLGLIAVALSTGMATIGAGYAVGAVGSSALGAVSENPKILGKTLIFVGLAEGIAIYGLIISILILGKL